MRTKHGVFTILVRTKNRYFAFRTCVTDSRPSRNNKQLIPYITRKERNFKVFYKVERTLRLMSGIIKERKTY